METENVSFDSCHHEINKFLKLTAFFIKFLNTVMQFYNRFFFWNKSLVIFCYYKKQAQLPQMKFFFKLTIVIAMAYGFLLLHRLASYMIN